MPEDPSGLQILGAVAPLRDVVRRLVREAQRIGDAAGRLPSANSPAMDELANQTEYAGRWSTDPMRLAQSAAGLCLHATEDHLETLCTVLDACPGAEHFRAPIFGHMPLARAAVETSGRAGWLLEPGIPYSRRATRGVAELFYSRWENSRATGDDRFFASLKVEVEAECKARGLAFDFDRGRVTVDEPRLGNEAVVRHLFRRKPSRLARTMYGYYSGVAHGVLWALVENVDLDHAPSSSLEADTRPLYSDARKIAMSLALAAEGYRIAVADRWDHMNWGSAEWDAGVASLDAFVSDLAKASTSGTHPT
jgi:hypothetical protein